MRLTTSGPKNVAKILLCFAPRVMGFSKNVYTNLLKAPSCN